MPNHFRKFLSISAVHAKKEQDVHKICAIIAGREITVFHQKDRTDIYGYCVLHFKKR